MRRRGRGRGGAKAHTWGKQSIGGGEDGGKLLEKGGWMHGSVLGQRGRQRGVQGGTCMGGRGGAKSRESGDVGAALAHLLSQTSGGSGGKLHASWLHRDDTWSAQRHTLLLSVVSRFLKEANNTFRCPGLRPSMTLGIERTLSAREKSSVNYEFTVRLNRPRNRWRRGCRHN
jgi:hypothetical protein